MGQHGGGVSSVQPDPEEGLRGTEWQDERLQRVHPGEHQRGEGVCAQECAPERRQRAGTIPDYSWFAALGRHDQERQQHSGE